MSFLDTIESVSFKKIFWGALLIGLALTIPVSVYLIQTETKLFSKADFIPPELPKLKRGSRPKISLEIDLVAPFLGKEGDIIIVNGSNFGYYPEGAYLQIGNTEVPEDHLVSWEDTKISFYLPTVARSGKLTINTGSFSASWPRIITVYDINTKTKISKSGERLLVSNAQNLTRLVYYDNKGERYEERLTKPLNSEETVPLVDKLQIRNVNWLTIFDPHDVVIPFYVSPKEFGF